MYLALALPSDPERSPLNSDGRSIKNEKERKQDKQDVNRVPDHRVSWPSLRQTNQNENTSRLGGAAVSFGAYLPALHHPNPIPLLAQKPEGEKPDKDTDEDLAGAVHARAAPVHLTAK